MVERDPRFYALFKYAIDQFIVETYTCLVDRVVTATKWYDAGLLRTAGHGVHPY